jgi:hypothetical protein
MTKTSQIEVFIPREDPHSILPHSGIVGSPRSEGFIEIDYEGNRYAANIKTFADRVAHAHGRHVTRYPTVARAVLPADKLVPVGIYDDVRGEIRLHGESERKLLCEWLAVEQLDTQELLTTGARHQARREIEQALASGDPRKQWAAREMAKRMQIALS